MVLSITFLYIKLMTLSIEMKIPYLRPLHNSEKFFNIRYVELDKRRSQFFDYNIYLLRYHLKQMFIE